MTNVITLGPQVPHRPAAGWRIEPVRPQDADLLAGLFARCSPETVRLRFFGRLRGLPRPYLDAVLAGRPEEHDAVLAYREGPGGPPQPVGLGSFAANRDTADPYPVGELGLLVTDAWQRRGAGAAMLDVLLDRARTRGARLVSASVLPGRSAMLAALTRRLEPVRMARGIDELTGVYRLDPE